MSHGGAALAALLVALPFGAARADAPPPTLKLLAPCGHELVYPPQGDDPGSSGLPPDQIPAPDRVHGVDAPVTSD